MMPDFTSSDPGTLGRAWRERCQSQIGPALVMGALIGFLVGGGLTARQVPPDSLLLWSKYQIAQAAAGAGLSSVAITWPGERGETETTVGELLQTPGLHAWAEPVSREIGAALLPAAVCSLLAFAVMLIWGGGKPAPAGRAVQRALPEPPAEPPLPAAPTVEAGPVAQSEPAQPPAEAPLPVMLPHLAPLPADPTPVPVEMPLPVTLPHLTAPAPDPLPTPGQVATQPEQPFAPSLPQTHAAPAGKKMLSYETHWELTHLPFENVPDPKYYFPAPMHEEALHRLLYGIQTGKGAVMLTGEIGCGKTLLSRELGLHLTGRQYDLALIANPSFGVEDFLAEVVYQLGMEPTRTKVKLLHMLNDRLLDNHKQGRQTVIVVDEAQAIPDDQVFEELRLLLNFQLNDRFLLTLVLMGQPELNDRVTTLRQFAQRISIKYHLGYFTEEQTAQYIRFRMQAAKCQKEVFTKEALESLYKYSGGVPRNINTLCDLCLLIGYIDRAAMVDQKIVERAAAERGQLGLF
jgi:general secretion pathway protein A